MSIDQNIAANAANLQPHALRNAGHVYANHGNTDIVALVPDCRTQLDIGCGAGGNARLVKEKFASCTIHGVTLNEKEANLASAWIEKCWIANLEEKLPADLAKLKYDVLFFSHVLEHFSEPSEILIRLATLLEPDGTVLIAVPNIVSWRMRVQLLLGDFEYQAEGVLDDTHLRFFTFRTAAKYLLARATNLTLVRQSVTGSVPLWIFRRYLLPNRLCDKIHKWACQKWSNLFGTQTLVEAKCK